MRYLLGLVIPFLLQALLVLVTIEMNTGNGSWLGLGALLIGMFAIPGTAIVNGIYIRQNRDKQALPVIGRCFLIALIVPIAVIVSFLFL